MDARRCPSATPLSRRTYYRRVKTHRRSGIGSQITPVPYTTTLLATAVLLLSGVVSPATAQTRFEALGGLPTPDIRITVGGRSTVLRTSGVGIVERPVVRADFDHTGGYGYAYIVPHLTFVTDTYDHRPRLRQPARASLRALLRRRRPPRLPD